MRCIIFVAVATMIAVACSQETPQRFPAGQLVDLSHAYDANAIFWPTADPFRLDKVADGVTPAGYYYAANNFFTSEHGGTHIDAPVHFAQGHQAVDEIPVDRFAGRGGRRRRDEGRGSQSGLPGLGRRLSARGTGRADPAGRDRADPVRFLAAMAGCRPVSRHGREGADAVSRTSLSGASPGRREWLIAERKIKAIGIDTASIDYGQSALFESHRLLYERDIPAFENLTSLERLPERGAYIVALPMKIRGGSGAPLRAIAIVGSQESVVRSR